MLAATCHPPVRRQDPRSCLATLCARTGKGETFRLLERTPHTGKSAGVQFRRVCTGSYHHSPVCNLQGVKLMKLFFAKNAGIIILSLLVSGELSVVHAQASNLMSSTRSVDTTTLTSKAQSEFNRLKADSHNSKVTSQHLDPLAFNGNIVSLVLGGKNIRLIKQDSSTAPDGSVIWIGQQDAYNSGVFSIKDGKVSGTINTRNGVFQIAPLEGDTHAIIQLDMPHNQPKDDTTDTPAGTPGEKVSSTEVESEFAATMLATSSAAAVTNPPVRILVAYSAHAAAALGSQLTSQINLAIAQINQANINSNVAFRAALAGTIQVAYTGPYTADATLAAFRQMPDVLSAHDSLQADLMVMLEAIPATLESGASVAINATASNAFAVVSTSYMTSNLSFAHEVGHLMGADHPQADTNQNVFRFGHGYWTWTVYSILSPAANCAHTIMSYTVAQSAGVQPWSGNVLPQCAPDPRITYWSSPTVYANTGSGAPIIMGATGTNDNAQVLNITGPVVTNFHNTVLGSRRVPPPGNPCRTNPAACR